MFSRTITINSVDITSDSRGYIDYESLISALGYEYLTFPEAFKKEVMDLSQSIAEYNDNTWDPDPKWAHPYIVYSICAWLSHRKGVDKSKILKVLYWMDEIKFARIVEELTAAKKLLTELSASAGLSEKSCVYIAKYPGNTVVAGTSYRVAKDVGAIHDLKLVWVAYTGEYLFLFSLLKKKWTGKMMCNVSTINFPGSVTEDNVKQFLERVIAEFDCVVEYEDVKKLERFNILRK